MIVDVHFFSLSESAIRSCICNVGLLSFRLICVRWWLVMFHFSVFRHRLQEVAPRWSSACPYWWAQSSHPSQAQHWYWLPSFLLRGRSSELGSSWEARSSFVWLQGSTYFLLLIIFAVVLKHSTFSLMCLCVWSSGFFCRKMAISFVLLVLEIS